MKYQYKAKDKTGKLQHSEIEADSIADARQKLRSQGLFVLELAAAETSTLSGGGTSRYGESASPICSC